MAEASLRPRWYQQVYRNTFAGLLRNYLKTRKCHSELVSESPNDGNNPDEILKRVQDDTLVYVLR